jgi:3-hydroxyisobutyrate dehydrogenase-like beta-hydroxyacid dehydrogenase
VDGAVGDDLLVTAAVMQREVTVVGLGAMGATLARTLARRGCDVTVWNRTASRAEPLTDSCTAVDTPAGAIAASPLTVLCVLNEEAVDEILAADGVAQAIAGKAIANLTTESIAATRRHADVVSAVGGKYLDGGILSYPRAIGNADAVILYSGDPALFAEHSQTLSMLAGAQRHVGDGDADATVAYGASWTYYYGGLGGFFEAAAYARASGIAIDELRGLADVMTRQLLDGVEDACDRLASGNFAGDQADVDGHIDGIPTFVTDAWAVGVRADMLDRFVGHCRLAAAAGDGKHDISTVVRALRAPR